MPETKWSAEKAFVFIFRSIIAGDRAKFLLVSDKDFVI
jgi:hypothetical protein